MGKRRKNDKNKQLEGLKDIFLPDNKYRYKNLVNSVLNMQFPDKIPCIADTAVLVIDMEEEFCSTKHPANRGNENTEILASKMGSMLNRLRNSALPIYLVRYPDPDKIDIIEDTFHKFSPEQSDKIFNKNHSSTFKGSKIAKDFEKSNIRNLIILGVNGSECVAKTALDGLTEKFNICIVSDYIADGKGFKREHAVEAKDKVTQKGGVYVQSDHLLNDITPLLMTPHRPKL